MALTGVLRPGHIALRVLEAERDLNLALRALIHSGVVKSAHDCSEGGLAVALAESCVSQQIARQTAHMPHSFLVFDFGTNEEAAQQAGRPDLIRWPKRVLAHLWEPTHWRP